MEKHMLGSKCFLNTILIFEVSSTKWGLDVSWYDFLLFSNLIKIQ